MSKNWFLGFFFLTFFLLGCQPAPVAVQHLTDADKEQILAFRDVHVKAMLSGDPAQAVATFDENAVLLPPGGKMVRGNAGVAGWAESSMEGETHSLTLTPVEIHGYKDLAYLVGVAEIKSSEEAPPALFNFHWVLKRQEDNSWRIVVDAWNSTPSIEGLVD